jgi:GT2 family glycosyltransferase
MVQAEFPEARLVAEPVRGLDFARNRALDSAKAEFIAFIDDDAVAESCWVQSLERAIGRHPDLVICTGRILPLFLETEGQRIFEANGGLTDAGTVPVRLPDDGTRGWSRRWLPNVWWAASLGGGCNMMVRRRAALELGGFDEALDLGADLPGGGDTEFIWRALESGAIVVYDPEVRVLHEHRKDRAAAVDQIIGHHRGLMAFLYKTVREGPMNRRTVPLAFMIWRYLKPAYRLLRRSVGRDPLTAKEILTLWRSSFSGPSDYARGNLEAARRRAGAVR